MSGYYADEHVKSAIVADPRSNGMDIATVQDRGQFKTDDDILLESETREGRVMLTNDTDCLRIHAKWMAASRQHGGIVCWPQNTPIGEVIRRILPYALKMHPQEAANIVKFI